MTGDENLLSRPRASCITIKFLILGLFGWSCSPTYSSVAQVQVQEERIRQACPSASEKNPYLQRLKSDFQSGKLTYRLRQTEINGGKVGWHYYNKLINVATAEFLVSCGLPISTSSAIVALAATAEKYIMEQRQSDDSLWWSGYASDGDENVDRMILLALLEAKYWRSVRGQLSDVEVSSLGKIFAVYKAAYIDKPRASSGLFPNQDAAELLLLQYMGLLTGIEVEQDLSSRLLNSLESNASNEGLLPYIGDEPAAAIYQHLIAAFLTRINQASPSPRLREILARISNAWQYLITGRGVVDYWSGPFFKQFGVVLPQSALTLSRCYTRNTGTESIELLAIKQAWLVEDLYGIDMIAAAVCWHEPKTQLQEQEARKLTVKNFSHGTKYLNGKMLGGFYHGNGRRSSFFGYTEDCVSCTDAAARFGLSVLGVRIAGRSAAGVRLYVSQDTIVSTEVFDRGVQEYRYDYSLMPETRKRWPPELLSLGDGAALKQVWSWQNFVVNGSFQIVSHDAKKINSLSLEIDVSLPTVDYIEKFHSCNVRFRSGTRFSVSGSAINCDNATMEVVKPGDGRLRDTVRITFPIERAGEPVYFTLDVGRFAW